MLAAGQDPNTPDVFATQIFGPTTPSYAQNGQGSYDPMTGEYWNPGGGTNFQPGMNYGQYAPATNPGLVQASQTQNTSGGSSGGGEEAGFSLDIPEDAYPWSTSRTGLPEWGLEPIKSIAARIPGLFDFFETSLGNLDNLPGLVDQWVDQSGTAYLGQLGDFERFLRKPLNALAGRGVLDSTMTRDAITNLGGLIADDFRQHQAEQTTQGLQMKAAGLVDTAKLRGSAAELGGSLLDLARTTESRSEDKLSRYTNMLALMLA